MNVFINPQITIVEAVKNKNLGYYTELEKSNTDKLLIKSKSASGRKRGAVGYVKRDGTITVKDEVMKYLTKDIRAKIIMAIELIYKKNIINPRIENGLVKY